MQNKRQNIHVLLADDHPAMRTGIRAILECAPDIEVVGEANDGVEVKELAVALHPQVLVLDLRMPGPRPADLVGWLQKHCPQTAVLILTAHNLDAYLSAVVRAGAAGFVLKEEAPETIVDTVRRAARRERLFSDWQLKRAQQWHREVGELWESLTEREREVLGLLAEGLSTVAIAELLTITPKTVEYHVTNILGKLCLTSRLEIMNWVHTHWPDGLPRKQRKMLKQNQRNP